MGSLRPTATNRLTLAQMKAFARLTEAARQLTPDVITETVDDQGRRPDPRLAHHRLLEAGLRNSDPAYRYCCPGSGPCVFLMICHQFRRGCERSTA
jgi:hypothetical protein